MKPKISSITLDGPIQRIYGGPIAIPIKIQFEDGIQCVGIGVTEDSTENSIDHATRQAINKCYELYSRLTNSKGNEVFKAVLLQASKVHEKKVMDQIKEKNEDSLKSLKAPISKRQKEEIISLCDTLGISPIPVDELNILEAECVIAELRARAKVYENQTDLEALKGIK